MAEDRSLPGMPKTRLVKEVKRVLWDYLRSRPKPSDRAWRDAWNWAHWCAIKGGGVRVRWPMAAEIATQFVVLSLAEMKRFSVLRLPRNSRAGAEAMLGYSGAILERPADAGSRALLEYAGQVD